MLLALLIFCLEVAATPQLYVAMEGFSFGETQDGVGGGISEFRIFLNRSGVPSAEHDTIEIPWHWELHHRRPGW